MDGENKRYKIALCQLLVSEDKEKNFLGAANMISEAAANEASVVCLPEIWNAPYDVNRFADYSEDESGPSVELMSKLAKDNNIYLIGGSIPEKDGDKTYNTSFIFDREGKILAKHRKVHLFDIDIEGGIRFKESDFFSAGNSLTLIDTDFGKIGVAICFDIRFPYIFSELTQLGAHIVFLPGAFNMTTGPAHWDLLIRSRALDNQIYFAACSPARNLSLNYHAYGHSCIATPWGDYCGATDANESIVYGIIDHSYEDKIRRELPIKD